MKKFKTAKQVKKALLNNQEVVINKWAIRINAKDEVEIWDPKGKGVVANFSALDRVVKDFVKVSQGIPNTMPKPVTYEATPSGSGPLGPDSTGDNPWKDPKVDKTPKPDGKMSDPSLGGDTTQDTPWVDPAINYRPEPNIETGGLPDTDLGPDSTKNPVEWEDKLRGPGSQQGQYESGSNKSAQDMDPGSDGQSEMGTYDDDDEYYPEIEYEPHEIKNKGETPSSIPEELGGRTNAQAEGVLGFLKQRLSQYDDWFDSAAGDHYFRDYDNNVKAWADTIEEAVRYAEESGTGDVSQVDAPAYVGEISSILFKLAPSGVSEDDIYYELEDIQSEALDLNLSSISAVRVGFVDTFEKEASPGPSYNELVNASPSQDLLRGIADPEKWESLQTVKAFRGGMGRGLQKDWGGCRDKANKGMSNMRGNPPMEPEAGCGEDHKADMEEPKKDKKKSRKVRRASLSFEDIKSITNSVDIYSTEDGEFDIRMDDRDNIFVVLDDDRVIDYIYYGNGQLGWDYPVPDVVDLAVSDLILEIEEENPDKYRHLYEEDEKPGGTFQPAYDKKSRKVRSSVEEALQLIEQNPELLEEGLAQGQESGWGFVGAANYILEQLGIDPKVDKEAAQDMIEAVKVFQKSARRRQAGPKLKENWGVDGGYSRDIEAESPMELYHLTRSFGQEDDYDWSKYEPNDAQAEADVVPEDPMMMEAGKEAADDKAKSYWKDYFKDYGEDLVKDDVTKKDRKETEPKVDETPKPAGQQKVKARRRRRAQSGSTVYEDDLISVSIDSKGMNITGNPEGFVDYEPQSFSEVLEGFMAQGAMWVDPEAIGALTDGEIIDFDGNLYWWADYAVIDEMQVLSEGGTITLIDSGESPEEEDFDLEASRKARRAQRRAEAKEARRKAQAWGDSDPVDAFELVELLYTEFPDTLPDREEIVAVIEREYPSTNFTGVPDEVWQNAIDLYYEGWNHPDRIHDSRKALRRRKAQRRAEAKAARRKAQAAPAAPMDSAPPGGSTPAAPQEQTQTPPGAPGAQVPAGKPQAAPGAGDEGLKSLGWTPEDIKAMSEEDKQKVLQVQLKKPGTGAPAAGAPAGQTPPKAPAKPAPQAPQSGPAPTPAAPGAGMPAPVAARLRRESNDRLKISRAFKRLAQAPIEEGVAPPAPQPSPSAPVQTGPQTGPQKADEFADPTSMDATSPDAQAMTIYSEILQKPVSASSPAQVPAMKAQELVQRLLNEVGMSMEEAKSIYGLEKDQGFVDLFK